MKLREWQTVLDRAWKVLRAACDSQDPPDKALQAIEELLAPLPLPEQVALVEFGRQAVLNSAPHLDLLLLTEAEADVLPSAVVKVVLEALAPLEEDRPLTPKILAEALLFWEIATIWLPQKDNAGSSSLDLCLLAEGEPEGLSTSALAPED